MDHSRNKRSDEGMADDSKETLIRWRLEAISRQVEKEPSEGMRLEPTEWPDEESLEAATRLCRMGIEIPWRYGQAFGDKDLKVIGLRAGAIGVVFFVESKQLGRKKIYATKTLKSFLEPDYLSLPGGEQEKISLAFLEEALTWLEMGQHLHIVAVHALKNLLHPKLKRNIPFVFSGFMPNGNLKKYLAKKRKLDLKESLILGIQLCDGLLHAYENGLKAHRDLKPDNIMLYEERIFKVTDFSANVIGTPGYMAPEQVAAWWRSQGKWIVPYELPVDHRADQFAVGLIALEAFLGRHPFLICNGACVSPERAREYVERGVGEVVDDSLPKSLKQILTHVFSPKPSDRIPDFSALRKELLGAYEMEFGTYDAPEVEIDDSASWWFERGEAFYDLGRAGSSEKPFKEAWERFHSIPGTELDQARCTENLGSVYRATGRFAEAESSFGEALGMYRRIPGTELQQAKCLANFAELYSRENDWSQARKRCLEALKLCEAFPPEVTGEIRSYCQEILEELDRR